MLSFNRASYLCEAIDSVLAQTIPPKGVFIYDNGSNSDVYDALEPYLKKGVRWFNSDRTRSAAWNSRRAFKGSKSKYTVVMHDDDKLCNTFLEEQVAFLEKSSNTIAIGSNGYLINEKSERTGSTVLNDNIGECVEFFNCSAQVAMKYANDSCIPLSSMMYRTEFVAKVDFREEEFEKVADAVFFCDMADIGPIALNYKPLYECRVHIGQDSSDFPTKLMNSLEDFFWSRKSKNSKEIDKLHKLLIKQHTTRNLRQILIAFRKPYLIVSLFSAINKIQEKNFSVLEALNLSLSFIKKSFFK
ncbi:glycosyltransferase family A protein [Alphaproteobacteria bacterium]|nr:glycosyltransferase family A protein [Alphaproteobacteria bacterium]